MERRPRSSTPSTEEVRSPPRTHPARGPAFTASSSMSPRRSEETVRGGQPPPTISSSSSADFQIALQGIFLLVNSRMPSTWLVDKAVQPGSSWPAASVRPFLLALSPSTWRGEELAQVPRRPQTRGVPFLANLRLDAQEQISCIVSEGGVDVVEQRGFPIGRVCVDQVPRRDSRPRYQLAPKSAEGDRKLAPGGGILEEARAEGRTCGYMEARTPR